MVLFKAYLTLFLMVVAAVLAYFFAKAAWNSRRKWW